MEREITEKIRHLIEWTQHNFANRVLGKICHFDDIINNPKYMQHIMDSYDHILKDVRGNPYKPSSALATLATSECFSAAEFLTIAKMAKHASASELKEFCELREQHTGGGLRMIDYLCFPMMVKMTKHLSAPDKMNLIMTKPELLSDTIYMYPALKELMPTERTALLNRATPEQKQHLKNIIEKADSPLEIVHYTASDMSGGYLWLVCVEAQSRYKNIRQARQASPSKIAHQNQLQPQKPESRQNG